MYVHTYPKSKGQHEVAPGRVPHKHNLLPRGPQLVHVLQHPPVDQGALVQRSGEGALGGVAVLDANDRDVQLTGPDTEVSLGGGGRGRGGGGGRGGNGREL